ncbi:MAG TPA: hypothetical protein VM841_09510 [Actinomycetota bacterium]|nr:hypothetical protein [Actinomycetota bacterium]
MSERIIDADDLRFLVRDEGAGDAVLLLHGIPLDEPDELDALPLDFLAE